MPAYAIKRVHVHASVVRESTRGDIGALFLFIFFSETDAWKSPRAIPVRLLTARVLVCSCVHVRARVCVFLAVCRSVCRFLSISLSAVSLCSCARGHVCACVCLAVCRSVRFCPAICLSLCARVCARACVGEWGEIVWGATVDEREHECALA